MTAAPTEGRPIAAWMQTLEFIEVALARRLAEVGESPDPSADAGPSAKASLQTLDEKVRRMQARLDQAERDAAEADEPLRTESEAYRRWTETMTAAQAAPGRLGGEREVKRIHHKDGTKAYNIYIAAISEPAPSASEGK